MPADRKDGYAVGYGRPPRRTRFKKGQSGNPRGRLKGTKNLGAVLMQALTETVVVTENGRRRKITKLEVMTKQLANKAATADLAAMKLLFGMIQLMEDRTEPAAADALEMGEEDQKVMKELYARLRSLGQGGGDA
jgi:hypothetical protein